MSPAVTVGLPYYNNAPFLAAAIRSVLRQSFSDWELLLVDDGSTDSSIQIARSFSDPRIHHICDGRNIGLACRLNQISAEARGQFLFRMDGDDLMHPDRIQEQLKFLRAASENTVVGTAAIEIDEHSRPCRLLRSRGARAKGYQARRAFLHPTVAAPTSWFRQNRYSENPLFRRSQDAELWTRAAAHSNFVLIDVPLLFYRWVAGSSFDKHLWQAMALLKILSRPESGNRVMRLGHAMLELTKLQVRFLQELRPVVGRRVTEPHSELTHTEYETYAAIIAGITLS